MPDSEQWRDIPGYEGYYQASSFGRVRGVDRIRVHSSGKRSVVRGKVLGLGYATKMRYPTARLSWCGVSKTYTVHNLVLLTFVGPRPEGMPHIRHLDGDATNCRLDNLAYGTVKENARDRWKHAAQRKSRTGERCSKGHDLTESETWGIGNRICQDCLDGKPRVRQLPDVI